MKKTTLALVLAFAVPVLGLGAEEDAKRAENFQKHKQERLQELDQRISAMQAMKSCLSGASDQDGVKKCHDEERRMMQDMRSKHAEKRKQHIDEQIKHLQDEKAKLDQKDAK